MVFEIPTPRPLLARVRALPGEHFLCAEVADGLALSPATLRRLGRKNVSLAPKMVLMNGTIAVSVYDADTVAQLQAHVAVHRDPRGRPRLWSDEERRYRRAAYCAAGYRRRRAVELHRRGDAAGAEPMLRAAEDIIDDLRREHRARADDLRRSVAT